MSGFDWAVIALAATGALVAVAAAVNRRRRRRGTELAQSLARGRTQLPERRIEVVAINDAKSTPEQKADP